MLPPLPLVMLVLSKGRKVSDGGYTAPGLFIPSPKDTARGEFCPNFSTKTNFREKKCMIYRKIKITIWDIILSLEKCGVAVLQMHQLQKEAEKESPQYLAKEFGIGYKLGRRQKSWRSLFNCCLSKVQIKFKAWHFQCVHAQSVSFLKLALKCFDK